MTGIVPKVEISPLSEEFTANGIKVDVQIYKLEGSDGWTLEIVVDEETSIAWSTSFLTDQAAWEEFTYGETDVGLLLESHDENEGPAH